MCVTRRNGGVEVRRKAAGPKKRRSHLVEYASALCSHSPVRKRMPLGLALEGDGRTICSNPLVPCGDVLSVRSTQKRSSFSSFSLFSSFFLPLPVYGHTTRATHDMSTPPPTLALHLRYPSMFPVAVVQGLNRDAGGYSNVPGREHRLQSPGNTPSPQQRKVGSGFCCLACRCATHAFLFVFLVTARDWWGIYCSRPKSQSIRSPG